MFSFSAELCFHLQFKGISDSAELCILFSAPKESPIWLVCVIWPSAQRESPIQLSCVVHLQLRRVADSADFGIRRPRFSHYWRLAAYVAFESCGSMARKKKIHRIAALAITGWLNLAGRMQTSHIIAGRSDNLLRILVNNAFKSGSWDIKSAVIMRFERS